MITHQCCKVSRQQHIDNHSKTVGLSQLGRRLEGCHQNDTQAPQEVAYEGDVNLAMMLQEDTPKCELVDKHMTSGCVCSLVALLFVIISL